MDLRWDTDQVVRGSIALLHGLNASADDWWRIGPALARQGWAVEALDLPGHGDGPRLTGPMDIEQLVEGTLERLRLDTDILVAHSMGCTVALEAASRRPGKVRALVLEEPVLGGPEPGLAELVREDARHIATDRAAAMVEQQRRNPGWKPEDVERTIDGILKAQTDMIADGLTVREPWRTAELLAATTLPTLVLLAQPPRSVVLGADRDRLRSCADQVVEFPAGHSLHRELPTEWLRTVGEFLPS